MSQIDFSLLNDPEYRASRERIREELAAKKEALNKNYKEFLTDAAKSPKLTSWEADFIKSLNTNWNMGIQVRFDELSEKQLDVAKRIQAKIYRIG